MHMSITTSFSNIQYSSPFLYDKFSLLLKCWLYFTSLDILNIHSFSSFLYVLFSFQGSLKFSHLSSYFLCLFICKAEKGRERERNREKNNDRSPIPLFALQMLSVLGPGQCQELGIQFSSLSWVAGTITCCLPESASVRSWRWDLNTGCIE